MLCALCALCAPCALEFPHGGMLIGQFHSTRDSFPVLGGCSGPPQRLPPSPPRQNGQWQSGVPTDVCTSMLGCLHPIRKACAGLRIAGLRMAPQGDPWGDPPGGSPGGPTGGAPWGSGAILNPAILNPTQALRIGCKHPSLICSNLIGHPLDNERGQRQMLGEAHVHEIIQGF